MKIRQRAPPDRRQKLPIGWPESAARGEANNAIFRSKINNETSYEIPIKNLRQ